MSNFANTFDDWEWTCKPWCQFLILSSHYRQLPIWLQLNIYHVPFFEFHFFSITIKIHLHPSLCFLQLKLLAIQNFVSVSQHLVHLLHFRRSRNIIQQCGRIFTIYLYHIELDKESCDLNYATMYCNKIHPKATTYSILSDIQHKNSVNTFPYSC